MPALEIGLTWLGEWGREWEIDPDTYTEKLGSGGAVCTNGDTPAPWQLSKFVVYSWTRRQGYGMQLNKDSGLILIGGL